MPQSCILFLVTAPAKAPAEAPVTARNQSIKKSGVMLVSLGFISFRFVSSNNSWLAPEPRLQHRSSPERTEVSYHHYSSSCHCPSPLHDLTNFSHIHLKVTES